MGYFVLFQLGNGGEVAKFLQKLDKALLQVSPYPTLAYHALPMPVCLCECMGGIATNLKSFMRYIHTYIPR